MNDVADDRELRIYHVGRRENLTHKQATAKVDAEIAEEEAITKAYSRLFEALREMSAA